MKNQQRSGTGLICLVLLMTIATLAIAGCTGSGQDQQSRMIPSGNQQSEHPAAGTVVATKITTAAAPLKTAQTLSAPALSTAGIAIDPISDKKAGDRFTVTATTSLPAGTNLLWQILPDTGKPPTGIDGSSQMSVGGNNLVTKGDGTANRISQAVDLGRLVPGKYVVIVGEMKGDFSDFRIGDRYGYTSFSIR
jgi:hypothetical protein